MALVYVNPTNAKRSPLEQWQRNTNAMGYGNKIRTDYMVQLGGLPRWFRVYAICHSNVASTYIMTKGEKLFISDCTMMEAIAKFTMKGDAQ